MSAYRLETFPPASGPSAVKIGPLERRIEAAREEAYHDGYLVGQAAATDGFLEEQGRLTSELIEAINDARVTNEAARRHVAASLAPMVEALAAAVPPRSPTPGSGRRSPPWWNARWSMPPPRGRGSAARPARPH